MDQRTCPECNASVTGRADKVYCSKSCSRKAGKRRYRSRMAGLGADYPSRPCPTCGTDVPTVNSLIYCSETCKPGVWGAIRCSRCEETLPATEFAPSHRKPGNWCRSCRNTYMAARQAQDRQRPRTCKMCGVTFTRWENYKHPGACANRCHECYKEYTRRRQTPNPKRRQLKAIPDFGQPGMSKAWKERRQMVIDSETNCGLCGELVDKSLHGHDPRAASVDHIMPIEWGGSNHRYNLQLAHRGCNSLAGRRMQDVRAAVARSALWIERRMSTNL